MPFFVEDWRWTVQNHGNMVKNADLFRQWIDIMSPIKERYNLNLPTVSEKIDALGLNGLPNAANGCAGDGNREELVWAIFHHLFDDRLKAGWLAPEPPGMLPEATQTGRAFARWVIGQMMVFSKYSFMPETQLYQRRITEAMLDGTDFDVERVKAVRGFFDQYLELLQSKSMITADDMRTYRTFYPLFEPFYVFYDNELEAYQSLDQLAAHALDNPTIGSTGPDSKPAKQGEPVDYVKIAFENFDVDNSGFLSHTELGSALYELEGHPPMGWEIDQAFATFDQNLDGKISLDEFRSAFGSNAWWGHTSEGIQETSGRACYPFSTGLHEAAAEGNITALQDALQADQDIESRKDKWQESALHHASKHGKVESVRFLLDAEAEVNAQTLHGYTSLHFAAENGHTNVVEVLLDSGADAGMSTMKGFTPMHCAVAKGNTNVVKLLARYSSLGLAVTTNAGDTPNDLARKMGLSDIYDIL